MIATILLLGFMCVVNWTDLRYGKIYNKVVYPGILLGLAANIGASLLDRAGSWNLVAQHDTYGLVGWRESIVGFLACSLAMLVCYVFFPANEIGGGDVKLIAMLGAWLGIEQGLQAMLWTLIVGGGIALILLVWRYGAFRLLREGWRYVVAVFRIGQVNPLTRQERKVLKTPLYLGPSALIAVGIVKFRLVEWF